MVNKKDHASLFKDSIQAIRLKSLSRLTSQCSEFESFFNFKKQEKYKINFEKLFQTKNLMFKSVLFLIKISSLNNDQIKKLIENESFIDLVKMFPDIKYFLDGWLNDDHSIQDESCSYEFRNCKPFIKSKSKSMNLNNQMIFDIKHCYCDFKFFNCLKNNSASSNLANKLGLIYFNYLKIKCFYYDYRESCLIYLFGYCVTKSDFKCHIKLRSNPYF